MKDMQRIALEQEFDEKSARITQMMARMEEMQRAYHQLEEARRARMVKDTENAAREETAQMERELAHCQQAKADADAAAMSGDAARIDVCALARDEAHRAFDLAERRMQDACRRYQMELARQGFGSEQAYRVAFMTKPAQQRLEAEVTAFREEYAVLLNRCEEIEKLLAQE